MQVGVGGGAALLIGAVGLGGVLLSGHASTPPAPRADTRATTSESAASRGRVDTAVTGTLVVAARLGAFDSAAPERRPVLLARSATTLGQVEAALAGVDLSMVDGGTTRVRAAQTAVRQVDGIVAGLRACLTARPATAQTKTTQKKTARSRHSKKQTAKRSGQKTSPSPQKAAATDCAISEGDVTVARTAGAAVAALIPYGSLPRARVQQIAVSVSRQAAAEARAGSRSTITVPGR